MKRKRAATISVIGEVSRPSAGREEIGRKSMGAVSIGELAGSLLRDVIRKRDESR